MAPTGSSDFDADDVISISRGNYGVDHESSNRRPPLISLSPNLYIRIQKCGRHYDIQTAITTFQRTTTSDEDDSPTYSDNKPTKLTKTVDLHALLHFGDISYYQYFNDHDTFCSRYDNVLYELIVEDALLAPYSSLSMATPSPSFTNTSSNSSHLKQLAPIFQNGGQRLNPIAPTQMDRRTASHYGLQCQVDGIYYCKKGWINADLTREEFLRLLNQPQQQVEKSNTVASSAVVHSQQPLWALASTSASYPGSELVTALLRPLTTSSHSASAALTRRLFTHLFLPGDALSGWIRAILWLGVPTPELSIMLVDWSSLSYSGRQSRRRFGGGGDNGNSKQDGREVTTNSITPVSPIAAPVLLSLLTGNWGTARRLIFGQVLVAGQSNSDSSKNGVLIEKRNERAMEVVRECLSSLFTTTTARAKTMQEEKKIEKRVALLYGAGHCRDLHRRLVQQEGLTPIRTEWRTAFRATVPRWGDFATANDRGIKLSSNDVASSLPPSMITVSTFESVAVGLVILPMYLLVGGFDWVSTMGALGNAIEGRAYLDGVAAVALYLVRHVALYVGISKFVVDWGGNDDVLFDHDDDRSMAIL
jgi:hypothetical protein